MTRVVRHLRRNIVAWVALFFALTGTGLAASRYVITSTSQIKPSVVRELRAPASTAAKAAKAAHAVVAKVRLVAPVTFSQTRSEVPVTGGTWTQKAGEDELIVGSATFTTPATGVEECYGEVEVHRDGGGVGEASASAGEGTKTYQLLNGHNTPMVDSLAEPQHATSHTITVFARDINCESEHVELDSLTVDVLGFH